MLKRVAVISLLMTTFATAAHAEMLSPGEPWELDAPGTLIAADVEELANEVGLEPPLLQGAVNTVKASPRAYLQHEGLLEPPKPAAAAAPAGPPPGIWDTLANCESSGNWAISTGNGFYGGLQFTLSTWQSYGGVGMPNHASRATQIAVAQRTQRAAGWCQWPACAVRLGLARRCP
jgi:hypothetical protein